jgi:hypothetical protein
MIQNDAATVALTQGEDKDTLMTLATILDVFLTF